MAKQPADSKEVKTSAEVDVKLLENSVIDSETKKDKTPFSRKNIVLLILFIAISIAILAVTIIFVLDIKFNDLFNAIKLGFTTQLGALWFVLLLAYFAYSIAMNYTTLWVRMRKWGCKVSQLEYWLFASAVSFIRAVTPPLFSDPYTLFWMKTKGIPTSKATSLIFTNTLFWQITQFLVSFPSFVMILISRDLLLGSWDSTLAFSLLCAGIGIDVICIVFMLLLCMSKTIHYSLSRIFNWFKKKLHMKYHTKAEIAQKYKERATIKRDFIEYLKDWKVSLITLSFFAINEIFVYLAVALSIKFVPFASFSDETLGLSTYKVNFDIGWVFNCANATFKANRLNIFIGGGAGTLEWFLSIFLVKMANFNFECISGTAPDPLPTFELAKSTSGNAILIWRTFGAYLPAVVGLPCLIGMTAKQIREYKSKKKLVH